ncbi:GNAT family N-acetyltransferase [Nocardia stercoris]|uniref:N-acetyltransferase n=1 Tax=Nocardia stercoris TaxID=2483361 RepID=A0A3M2L053_9NOCA|nr:GNAT family N-acetyltransferase [Nocardia stercoris]RMI31052.1 N-acetyltransferase [Nocardia stercoris]
MTDQAVTATVARNDAQHRFEVWYGDRLAGFAEFRERDRDIVFIATEVDTEFTAIGLGDVLVREAVEDVIERDLLVVARCPFLKGWLDKHPEFDAHVVGKGVQR